MKAIVSFTAGLMCTGACAQTLPDFSFRALDSSLITQRALVPDQPVVVFYYDPYCEDCIDQAKALKAASAQLDSINLVWVSWSTLAEGKTFSDEYFENVPSAIVCVDDSYEFDNLFGYSEMLTIFCYDASWQQVARFAFSQSVEELLSAVWP